MLRDWLKPIRTRNRADERLEYRLEQVSIKRLHILAWAI